MYQPSTMAIQKFILLESGTYSDMHYRPYEPVIESYKVVNQLQEIVGSRPQVTATGLAGIASQIMAPSGYAQGQVAIPGGWGERRFFFIMEVDFPSKFGMHLKEIIQGYSNYVGASLQTQAIDDNMELHINSVTTLRLSVEDHGYGPMEMWVPYDNSQILYGDYSPSLTNIGNQPGSIRPMDIFDAISLRDLPPDASRLDQRTTFSEGGRKSSRINNSTPRYLQRVLKAASTAFAGQEMSTSDMETVMAQAADSVEERRVSEDSFMQTMSERGAFLPNGNIQMRSIFALDPYLRNSADNRMQVFIHSTMPNRMAAGLHARGTTEHWNGDTRETRIANQLAQAITGMMTECLLSKCHIHITNRHLDHQVHVIPDQDAGNEAINGYIRGMDITRYVHRFFGLIENEVMRDITMNGIMDIAISLRAEISRETWIRVQIGNGPQIDYVYPSFADSSFVATMSPNQQFLGDLAGKLGTVINTINTTPGHAIAGGSPQVGYQQPYSSEVMAPSPSNNYNYGENYGTSGAL
ncbi:MAG TPA: hypothetical protein VN081_01210 [Dongiaceae bacterium]|nr:hypothetical protein [Dongiaceae bacterium]